MQLAAPEPLSIGHRIDAFDCGEPVLDEWLRKRALGNQSSGASRTFVVADASGRVMGYYALAAGAVAHETATSAVRRNMPDPVPVLVLGRLAVDRQAQGMKLGASLLQDAVKRAIGVSADAGIRALLVHALSEPAKQFYLHYGFQASTLHPMTLMMRLPHP
ncbi:MAG: GNAT family N-acetyltransferase [Piscinibacter sp.]|uniref:GNAT family N-acetyltransferase n=1 Tax=Piscinibacter sp. TaxID=1903157 RepID=UPI003D0F872D